MTMHMPRLFKWKKDVFVALPKHGLRMGHFHSTHRREGEQPQESGQHGSPAAMFGSDRGGDADYRQAF